MRLANRIFASHLGIIVDGGEERALAEAGAAPRSRAGGVLVLPRIAGRPSEEYLGGAALCLFSTSPGPLGWAFADIVLNGTKAVVRRMQAILFGTATVFLGDSRVATTVEGGDSEIRELAHAFNPAVWCESDPGSGTSFFIWLPRVTGGSP